MTQPRQRELWRKRRWDIAALSIIVIFFLVFFRRAIFGGQFLLGGDPLTYSYPLRTAAWEMIRQGYLPLWTPLILSGYPLLSMAQVAVGYPLTWGYLFLPGYWAEQIFVLAPYLLAPAFAYAYAREVGRSPLASLLAGLSFGYGGLMLSPLGSNGMLTNAVMWAPLILIAVERARTRRFTSCLLLATFAYTMSVLTGVGQGFTYVGLLALLYAAFVALAAPPNQESRLHLGRMRWRPVWVVVGAIILSTGLAAFQIFETMRAVRQSVRRELTYEHFSEGSFPFSLAWKSAIDPIHHNGDVTTYLAIPAFLLAISALIFAAMGKQSDRRIWFWLTAAAASFTLILGSYTPLYPLVYQIPFINRFRVPSRHSFEWTFAVSILASYGWDAWQKFFSNRVRETAKGLRPIYSGLCVLCLLAGIVAGIGWRRAWRSGEASTRLIFGDLNANYLGWKIAFSILLLMTMWFGWKMMQGRLQALLLATAIAFACFIEPSIGLTRWVEVNSEAEDRFGYLSPITRLVRQYPPEQNRFYPQRNLSGEDHVPRPFLDPLNWSAIAGVQSIAAYEPLIMERYSRALNSSDWNSVNRAPHLAQDLSLFEARSHVLDLLNVTFVGSYSNLNVEPERFIERDAVLLSANASSIELSTDSPAIFTCAGVEGDTLAIVSALAYSNHIGDGTAAAKISIQTIDGRTISRELRAGDDSAEWAHERPDVRAVVRHRLAPVFDTRPGDERNSFPSHRYWARVNLGERARVKRVEIIKTLPDLSVVIWSASLYDSATRRSTPLTILDTERWETIYQEDGVILLRNLRALPRAWLVTEALAVDQTEAWAMIRGRGKQSFDPRRTALLEIEPSKMPPLTGRPLTSDSYARILNYEPNRLAVETYTDQQAALVLSEMNYPGWSATLDGVKTPIHQTNFLLRGVIVPPGKHRVEMSYKAPGARNGAIISLLTLALIGGMVINSRRRTEG